MEKLDYKFCINESSNFEFSDVIRLHNIMSEDTKGVQVVQKYMAHLKAKFVSLNFFEQDRRSSFSLVML